MATRKDRDQLTTELERMRNRLDEALDALEAIRSGRVDALLVKQGETDEQVYILEGADRPYRVMVELMNEGAATLAAEGTILYANAYFANLLQAPLHTVLGAPFISFVAPDDQPEFSASLEMATKERHKIEMNLQSRNGSTVPVLLSFSPLKDQELSTVCIVVTDLTEQKQMHRKLQAEIAERKQIQADLAEIQSSLMENIEEERVMLARDLHDGPMQDIFAVMYTLALLSKGSLDADLREKLGKLERSLKQINRNLRSTARNLLPTSLAAFGLEKSIREHIHNTRVGSQNLEVHLDLMEDGQLLPEQMRLALFRIYQIAITNALRHSNASMIDIRFFFDSEKVILEIEDDGQGFTVPERWIDFARQGHLGLVGAQDRARTINGELEVRSQPGQGCLVRVTAARGNSKPV